MDPLSLLSSKKKEEAKAKPAAKPPSSLFGDSSNPLGPIGEAPGIGGGLTDVTAALGGARRNPAAVSFAQPSAQSFAQPSNRGSVISAQTESATSFAAPPVSFQRSSVVSGVAPGGGGKAAFDDMLEGEKVAVTVPKCFLKVTNPLCEVPGRILCTNYRLKFQNVKGGLREELQWMQKAKYFDVPMGTLEELKVDSKQTVTGATEVCLRVTTKDMRLFQFLMTSEEECRDVLSAVSSFSHPGNPSLLFAVKYCEEFRKLRPEYQASSGWDIYDPLQEYSRMGIDTDLISNPSCPWKASKLNIDYGLCSTYPANLVLPKKMADHEIRGVAHFRKRGRLPALSWCGGPELNYASVWRCSQTTEGLMGQKSPEDEKHVRCLREGLAKATDRDLLVVDLRPWKAAWANKAGGGGFEGYDNCNLVFGGIDNIHCVRDGWKGMGKAVDNVIDGEVGSWMKDVANSNWYDYIGAILNCARKVLVEILHNKSNVMVHCSDGWDRTAQTTSLAMLCIDPHYRTQVGLLKLIQKEWCSFGHKFRTRLALGEAPTSEASPVFVQWLEAVYQVIMQNPNMFEFTPEVLIRLATEATSNRYGTFLTDCERERLQAVAPHTLSLWSILMSEADTWRNPNYLRCEKPYILTVSQACFTVWEAYWFRYHPRGMKLRATQAEANPNDEAAASDPLGAQPASSSRASTGGLNPLNPLGAAPAPPAAETRPSVASVESEPSLFTKEEIVSAPKAKPKTFFQADDDDDEDVFAKPKK